VQFCVFMRPKNGPGGTQTMAIYLAGNQTTRRAGRPLGELATQSTIYSNDQKCIAKNI